MNLPQSMSPPWKVGDRVRVNLHHWARPHAVGTIEEIDMERDSEHVYYVRFDQKGRGIEGHFLWLDAYNMEHFDESTRPEAHKPNPKKSPTNE